MTLVESPPDSVQVYWEMDLDPSFSVYQFDLNVFNTTSQENTLFENIKGNGQSFLNQIYTVWKM